MEERAGNSAYIEAIMSYLDDGVMASRMGDVYKSVVEAVERPLIEKVLERTFGNQLKAAKILGISRNTLRSKINKFGIDAGRWKI